MLFRSSFLILLMSGWIVVSPFGRIPSFGFAGAAEALVDTAEREHPAATTTRKATTKTRPFESLRVVLSNVEGRRHEKERFVLCMCGERHGMAGLLCCARAYLISRSSGSGSSRGRRRPATGLRDPPARRACR